MKNITAKSESAPALEHMISREEVVATLGVALNWCIRRENSGELTKYQTGPKGKVFYDKRQVMALFQVTNGAESK